MKIAGARNSSRNVGIILGVETSDDRRRHARLLAAIAMVVALGAALWFATRSPPLTVQGKGHATGA